MSLITIIMCSDITKTAVIVTLEMERRVFLARMRLWTQNRAALFRWRGTDQNLMVLSIRDEYSQALGPLVANKVGKVMMESLFK